MIKLPNTQLGFAGFLRRPVDVLSAPLFPRVLVSTIDSGLRFAASPPKPLSLARVSSSDLGIKRSQCSLLRNIQSVFVFLVLLFYLLPYWETTETCYILKREEGFHCVISFNASFPNYRSFYLSHKSQLFVILS